MPTGQTFHCYINPERDMPAEAFAVHGLSAEFLSTKPLFAEVAEEFLAFIADAPLVIHNASFDIGFINAELARLSQPPIPRDRLVDTLLLARRKHPGGVEPARRSVLALCDRQFAPHQARRAARRRTAGRSLCRPDRRPAVAIDPGRNRQRAGQPRSRCAAAAARDCRSSPGVSEADREAHRAFVATLGDKPIWNEYLN